MAWGGLRRNGHSFVTGELLAGGAGAGNGFDGVDAIETDATNCMNLPVEAMELDAPISPDLAATMLYAIESDLAGTAGTPGGLDNIALSGLTLKADPAKLHRMRYVDLPQSYYIAYATGLSHAMFYDNAIFSHLDVIDSLEKPAVLADLLLRFDQVDWALVVGICEGKMVLSLRTSSGTLAAGTLMQRLLRGIGEGGGHRTKAGGMIRLATGSPSEIERLRTFVRRRYLRALAIHPSRGQKLVPLPG